MNKDLKDLKINELEDKIGELEAYIKNFELERKEIKQAVSNLSLYLKVESM